MVFRFLGAALCCSALLHAEITPGSEPAEVYVKSFDAAYIAAAIRKPPNPAPCPPFCSSMAAWAAATSRR